MAQVSGRCVDVSGAPASGVYVYATPATGARFGKAPGAHTDRDGRWSLELSAGAWTVRETGHATYEVAVDDARVELAGGLTVPQLSPVTRPRQSVMQARKRRVDTGDRLVDRPMPRPREGGRLGPKET